MKKVGAYLPGAYEEVVDVVNAHVLTEKKALHMRAKRTFTDDKGVTHRNGEEWLIKFSDTETHIPGVYEEVVRVIDIQTLNNRQYCVIEDPADEDGKPQLGQRKLVKVCTELCVFCNLVKVCLCSFACSKEDFPIIAYYC